MINISSSKSHARAHTQSDAPSLSSEPNAIILDTRRSSISPLLSDPIHFRPASRAAACVQTISSSCWSTHISRSWSSNCRAGMLSSTAVSASSLVGYGPPIGSRSAACARSQSRHSCCSGWKDVSASCGAKSSEKDSWPAAAIAVRKPTMGRNVLM